MVRVSKIAVWDVNGELVRDALTATKRTRLAVIQEMLVDEENMFQGQTPAEWMSENWDTIENRVKAAMAGT